MAFPFLAWSADVYSAILTPQPRKIIIFLVIPLRRDASRTIPPGWKTRCAAGAWGRLGRAVLLLVF